MPTTVNGIDPELIRSPMQTARLGADGALALVAELRIQLSSQPFDVGAVISLCEALAVADQAGQINAEINAWQNRATPTIPVEVIGTVRALGLYYAGRFEECAARCRLVPSLKSGALHLESLLALKKVKEVTADPAFSGILADPRFALSASLAFVMENQPDEASRWRDTAIANMANASRGMRRAARILADAAPTPAAEFDRIQMDADWKAVVLLIQGERHPAKRSECLASAVKFNVRRRPPYHLIRQGIERASRAAK